MPRTNWIYLVVKLVILVLAHFTSLIPAMIESWVMYRVLYLVCSSREETVTDRTLINCVFLSTCSTIQDRIVSLFRIMIATPLYAGHLVPRVGHLSQAPMACQGYHRLHWITRVGFASIRWGMFMSRIHGIIAYNCFWVDKEMGAQLLEALVLPAVIRRCSTFPSESCSTDKWTYTSLTPKTAEYWHLFVTDHRFMVISF